MDKTISNETYIYLLHKFLERLNGIRKIKGFDDCTMGCKETYCSVGFCGMKDFIENKHYRNKYHRCPLDRRSWKDSSNISCFYSCDFFKPKRKIKKITIKQLKERFELLIGSYELNGASFDNFKNIAGSKWTDLLIKQGFIKGKK